jgi:hypothetical protein
MAARRSAATNYQQRNPKSRQNPLLRNKRANILANRSFNNDRKTRIRGHLEKATGSNFKNVFRTIDGHLAGAIGNIHPFRCISPEMIASRINQTKGFFGPTFQHNTV